MILSIIKGFTTMVHRSQLLLLYFYDYYHHHHYQGIAKVSSNCPR